MANLEIIKSETWNEFKANLAGYCIPPLNTRRRIIFRGHAYNGWNLKPTIDRLPARSFSDDEERAELLKLLINEFRRCCQGLRIATEQPNDEDFEAWEYLGRHHGLPTTIIDWTDSPYVAAYFAFECLPPSDAEYASVWAVNQSWITPDVEGVEIRELDARFNVRSAEQRGLSMRIKTVQESVENLLRGVLYRFDINQAAREDALADLDEMLVTRRTLFRDLEGAAKTASLRLGCGT